MPTPTGTGFQGPGKRLLNASLPPWKTDARWKRLKRHARAIKFIQTYCRSPKGVGYGKPMHLARFQKEFLEDALAKDVDAAVLETPRGNGKSTFGGALAAWATFDDDETGAPQVPIVATTISQAIRSCYGVAVAMVKAEPEMLNRALIYTGIATPRVTAAFNNGELFPISNDPDGLQGLDPSLAIVDEVGFQPIESWDSVRLASGKRSRSLIVGVGTPGLDRGNALFYVRNRFREGGARGFVFHEYGAPEGAALDDHKAWRIANPAIKAGFLRESALETDLGMTPEGHFRIFRLGQWYEGVDSWLGPSGRALWDHLADPMEPQPKERTWVGVDVGIKRDSTAVAYVQRRPDGRLHGWAKLWIPQPDQPVDVTDVMGFIRQLDKLYDVEAVSYDPRFFDVPAKMLTDEGLPLVEVPQSVEQMTPIIGSLYELLKRAELHHNADPGLTDHVLNAVARVNERGFTLAKSKSRGRIDGVIALALAVDRALHAETAAVPEFIAL